MPSRRPRARALVLIAGIILLAVVPGAIAPAPPAHIEGRSQLTDAHLESDSGNITTIWALNHTVGNKLWMGNATDVYLERDSTGSLRTNATILSDIALTSAGKTTGTHGYFPTLFANTSLTFADATGTTLINSGKIVGSHGYYTTSLHANTTGSSGGVHIGDDVQLYDGGADLLVIPDRTNTTYDSTSWVSTIYNPNAGGYGLNITAGSGSSHVVLAAYSRSVELNGLEVRGATLGAGTTAAFLLVELTAGVYAVKNVQVGAADSAGTGYRALRVTN